MKTVSILEINPVGDGRSRTVAGMALLAWMLSGFGCGARPEAPANPPSTNAAGPATASAALRVRAPAVAGLFYPADAPVLAKTIDGLLQGAPEHYLPRLKGLVCPHAGYTYSGPTAASAYKLLAGRNVQTVVILAPSHYAGFAGASLPNADAYRTPLGLIPISEKVKALMSVAPFVREAPCRVSRPPWWQQSTQTAPPLGEDTPETWEHSIEVQLPFLQKTLASFKVLPVVYGEVDPEKVAQALADRLDDTTLIVASSDLSHYHPYAAATGLDRSCVKAICDLDIEHMKTQEACGKVPILTLMYLARLKGWQAQLLDYRNSGDVTGGKDSVVGYAAVAFYAPRAENLAAPERQSLLELARRTLTCVVTNGRPPAVPDLSPKLAEKKGCFVTLTKNGSLRGCIGNLLPQKALAQAVVDNAQSAALHDPRFPPVQSNESDQLKIEISVLTEPQPLRFSSPEDLLNRLQPYEDGVLLQMGARAATFLPQVWAQIPGKVEFLNRLAEKAGCEPSAWRGPETAVFIYHVESFAESERSRGPQNR